MAKLSRRQLITYAVVSQELNNSDDFLLGLMPFFDPIINEMDGQIFDAYTFSEKIVEQLDWPVNPDVVTELLPRLEGAGRVERIADDDGDAVFICRSVKTFDGEEKELLAVKQLREIAVLFKKSCDDISPVTTNHLSYEDLEEMLLNWMVAVEGFDRKALIAAVDQLISDHNTLGKDPADYDNGYDNGWANLPARVNRDDSYLCARFVSDLAVSDADRFEHLADIASLALLTEVILDIRNPPDANRKEPSLVLFLDAPLVMDALGLSGLASKNRIDEMLAAITNLNAKVWVFDHSCVEISRNLKNGFDRPVHQRANPTNNAILNGELTEGYARDVMSDPVHYVTSMLGLDVSYRKLAEYPNTHKFFDNNLYDDFANRLFHSNPLARESDATSATLIMRRRGDVRHRDPLKTKFLMITTNRKLVEFSNRFCVEYDLIRPREVGPMIHHRAMVALMMLTLGYQGKKQFSRRQVLGTCERVVRMQPNVVRRAWDTLKKVKPELLPQLEALLTRPRSAQVLMEKTLGIETAIRGDNIVGILEAMEQTTGDRVRKEAEDRRREDAMKHEKTKSELETTLIDINEIASRRESEIEVFQVREQQMISGWLKTAAKNERAFQRMQMATLMGLAIIFSIAPLYVEEWAVVAYLGAGASLVFSLCSLVSGFPNISSQYTLKAKKNYIKQRASEARCPEILDHFDIDWAAATVERKKDDTKTDLFDL